MWYNKVNTFSKRGKKEEDIMNIKNGKKRIVYAIAWLLTVSFLLTDTLSVLAADVNYSYDKSVPQINADSDVKTGKAFEPGDRICFNESNAEAPAGEGEISYKKADGTSLTQEVLGIAAFPYVGTADPSGNSLMLPAFQTNGCTKWKVSEADVYTLGDAKKIKLTLIEAYEIEWNLNGGTSTLSFIEAYAPSETLILDTPTKANSIFDGWTYQFEGDQTATTLAANSTGSYPIPLTGKSGKLTITAVWKRPYVPYIPVIDWEENKDDEKSHRITYVLGEGATNDASNPATYYEGSGVAELKPAVKPNYDFEGWYEDEACTKKVDSISASSTGDVTVYASFTPKRFKITYVLDGGVNSDKNPTTYTYGEGIKYLEKPKKKAYDCMGWYWRSGGYGSLVESISNKQSGDITLYAYYIPVPDLTGATIRLDQYEFKYTGKERKVGIYDIKLADGMMFSRIDNVKITGDRATDIGEHILTMTGDGDRVTGSCSVVYTIKKIDLETEVDVSFDKESFTYKKSKKQKPKVTLKLKSSGKEVSSDWYSVEYPEDQVNAGEKI